MGLLFRKYFWVANLAFRFVAAFLCAKTGNVLVAGRLAPLPEFNASSGPAIPQMPQKTPLRPEAFSKVTGIELPKPEEVKPDEPIKPEAPPDISTQEAV